MIDVDYNEYKKTIGENIKLITKNHELKQEIERLSNIINELEKDLNDNIDTCNNFIESASTDLQKLGTRQNGKTYYQTLLLENEITLKTYKKELNKLNKLKRGGK